MLHVADAEADHQVAELGAGNSRAASGEADVGLADDLDQRRARRG